MSALFHYRKEWSFTCTIMVFCSSLPLLLLLIFLADLCYSTTVTLNTTSEYLKVPLLHRTTFNSPAQALPFDIHRLSLLHHKRTSLKSPIVSGAFSGSGQYFATLSLGSPPQSLLLVVDTGSDLVWVKCSACKNCSNHSTGSSFLARHSSTFFPIHCFNSLCQQVPHPRPNPCNHTQLHSPCRYEYSYSDNSRTSGFFSKETMTFNTSSGRVKKLKNLAFGCGFRISGPSLTGASFGGAHGVMGLGRAPISFSSQFGRRFGNRFSYCLMDYTLLPPPTSYLLIGGLQDDFVSDKRLNFTPILVNPFSPTFYYIDIKSVSVDGVKLSINPFVWSIDKLGNGGTIIDSGTTLTFLVEPAYSEILKAFKNRVKLPSPAKLTPGFDLCVNMSDMHGPVLPKLSFKFAGNTVFSPPSRNYFIETEARVKCLAIQPVNSRSGSSVIGNLMQQGYLLAFDRDRSRLGFSRYGCALP